MNTTLASQSSPTRMIIWRIIRTAWLFADGHVEWIDAKLGAKVIAQAAAGQTVHLSTGNNSVPVMVTQPSTN